MPEMPTLGQPEKKSVVPQIAVFAILVGLIFGGIYAFQHRGETPPETPAPAADAQPAAPPAPAAPVDPNAPVAAAPAVPGAPSQPGDAAPIAPSAPAPIGAQKVADLGGLKSFTATITGPMELAVVDAVGKQTGAPLTQVINRSLVWWMNVPGDLLKGDTLSVVYEERDHAEPVVHAVRFNSRKFGKTFEAYRFKSADDQFPRFWQPDGAELEQRLVDGPLDQWEQVTSLLRDGRKHKGVDFKTPVGTPVKATFDGTITRKNWNFKGNGNSLELVESGGQGRTALYLHLSELPKSLQPGQRVKRGEVIGKSGNTGRSFAPHLHYQLMRGEKVIDPFESHKTTQRKLDPAQLPALDKEVARLKNLLGSADSQTTGAFGSR